MRPATAGSLAGNVRPSVTLVAELQQLLLGPDAPFPGRRCINAATGRFVAMAAALIVGRCVRRAARHTLMVEAVEVQREGAGEAGELAGAAARPARLVTRFARLRRRIVVL